MAYCPKCKSRNVAIVLSNELTFKCLNCSYTWTLNVNLGYINIGGELIHWTEIEAMKIRLREEVKNMALNGMSAKDIIEEISKKASSILSRNDIIKVVKQGLTLALEYAQFRDRKLYEYIRSELEKIESTSA